MDFDGFRRIKIRNLRNYVILKRWKLCYGNIEPSTQTNLYYLYLFDSSISCYLNSEISLSCLPSKQSVLFEYSDISIVDLQKREQQGSSRADRAPRELSIYRPMYLYCGLRDYLTAVIISVHRTHTIIKQSRVLDNQRGTVQIYDFCQVQSIYFMKSFKPSKISVTNLENPGLLWRGCFTTFTKSLYFLNKTRNTSHLKKIINLDCPSLGARSARELPYQRIIPQCIIIYDTL